MSDKVVVLTGGVGGAKLVLGMIQVVPAEDIIAIVNTGDDFRHLGLYVSPDIDTLLYTLSGKSNETQGWGRGGESWNFMAALKSLGGEDWFALGDGDLALHVQRSHLMAQGLKLSAITAGFAASWGIKVAILPMTDDAVATFLDTDEGIFEFQRYFVEKHCNPCVSRIMFRGAEKAEPAPGLIDAILKAKAVILAPSNPYLSVDPILSVPGIASALRATEAKVIAVSPIIAGNAVKGPTAKLMEELGIPITNQSIAAHYEGIINGLIIDTDDDAPDGVAMMRTGTMMNTLEDRARVARRALDLAHDIYRK